MAGLQDAPLWRDDPGVSPAAAVMLVGSYSFDEEAMLSADDVQDRMIDSTLLSLVHRRAVSVTREGELILRGAPARAYATETDLYRVLEALRYEGGGHVFLKGARGTSEESGLGTLEHVRQDSENRAFGAAGRVRPTGSSSAAWMQQFWLDADIESGSRSQANTSSVTALGISCMLVSTFAAALAGSPVLGVFLCVWGCCVWFDSLRKFPRLSPELAQAVVCLKGLERWLEDFTRLEETSAADLVLWDGYMVYATAMGIPDNAWDYLSAELGRRPVVQGSAPVLDALGERGVAGMRL